MITWQLLGDHFINTLFFNLLPNLGGNISCPIYQFSRKSAKFCLKTKMKPCMCPLWHNNKKYYNINGTYQNLSVLFYKGMRMIWILLIFTSWSLVIKALMIDNENQIVERTLSMDTEQVPYQIHLNFPRGKDWPISYILFYIYLISYILYFIS